MDGRGIVNGSERFWAKMAEDCYECDFDMLDKHQRRNEIGLRGVVTGNCESCRVGRLANVRDLDYVRAMPTDEVVMFAAQAETPWAKQLSCYVLAERRGKLP